MATFDGWNARVAGGGGAGMVCRDVPGWVMTYQSNMTHGGTFGRGHYRGNREVTELFGSRGHARKKAAQKMPTQGVIGAAGTNDGVVLRHGGISPAGRPEGMRRGTVQGKKYADGFEFCATDLIEHRDDGGAVIGGFEWNQGNALTHFRTKGSKNGVRRYQNPDGTWTPLGLKERREREGFGEGRAARKEARAQKRTERAAARATERARRAEALAKYNREQAENRRRKNPKNLTDDELRSGIERLKMEQEYRELNRNPLAKTAQSLVKNLAEAKAQKERQEQNKFNAETNRIRALAELQKAKAENRKSKSDLIDSVNGTKRREATTNLLKQKNERQKHTVTGAIRQSVHDILSKEGNRLVKDMSDESLISRGGRKIKRKTAAAVSRGKALAGKIMKDWQYGTNMNRGSGPDLN